MADTPQRAEQRAQFCLDQVHAANPMAVSDALEKYRNYLASKGNKPESIENTSTKLRRFFTPVIDVPLVRVTKPKQPPFTKRCAPCPASAPASRCLPTATATCWPRPRRS